MLPTLSRLAGQWVRDAIGDVPFTLRTLMRAPAFAFTIVLTIGLAVGGAGAVFSLVDTVLLQPLPYRDPDKLVVVGEREPNGANPHGEVAPVNYDLLTRSNQLFTSIAAVAGFGATLSGGDTPEKVQGRRVTQNFFELLGVAPAIGRTFAADEDRPGGPRVVILSHRLWRDRFGGDPRIIGRDIVLDREHYSIIGVAPRGFQFLGADADFWTPAAFSADELAKGSNYLTIVARLPEAASIERAQAYLDQLARRLAGELPPAAAGFQLSLVSLQDVVAGDAPRTLLVLLTAIAFVMLIACANVAGLLMARGTTREREMALRRSLGATRSRIVRQLLVESLVLSVLALLAGVAFAHWALAFLVQLVPPDMFLFARPSLDARALGVTSLTALMTGALFGLAPALRVTAVEPAATLRSGGRSVSGRNASRRVLVVAEVAMTLVLLVVAGLLIQTVYRLRYADLGFQPAQVLSLRTVLPSDTYSTQEQRVAFFDAVLERVARLPGVTAVGYSTSVPLAWKGATTGLVVDGGARATDAENDANIRQVSDGYLQALRVPLLEGRHFTDGDRAGAPPVAIINRAMARLYFPDEGAVGRRIRTTDGSGSPWLTVVGVVGDVRQMGLDLPARPELYVPYRQFGSQPWFAPRDLVVRATGDSTQLGATVIREIHTVDPTLPVTNVRPLSALLDEEVASRRLGTYVLIAFAAFAVVLAVVGIYGLISYFVVQHTPEIGVRVALGAHPRDILSLVVGKGLGSTAIGVATGALGALGASRVVKSLLYGVSALDPMTLVLASALLFTVASIASYLPARRALKLDAMEALRRQ